MLATEFEYTQVYGNTNFGGQLSTAIQTKNVNEKEIDYFMSWIQFETLRGFALNIWIVWMLIRFPFFLAGLPRIIKATKFKWKNSQRKQKT